jgi:DNA-binding Lrp family transcriptional regulator
MKKENHSGGVMIFGMTMVKVKPGQESLAYQAIQAIKGIKEIYRIFGEFSFFLIMDALAKRDLDHIVEEIQMTRGVIEIRPILVTAKSDPSEAAMPEFAETALS